MALKTSTKRLHDDVRREFQRMSDIKAFGVPKYTTAYIMGVLAEKFYKAPKTIENIVFNRYRDDQEDQATQPDLFTE